jgi:hypothetical protein
MSAHIEFGVVEYLFLKELLLLLLSHFLFHEMKGDVNLLSSDGLSHSFLFLKNSTEIIVIDIIFAAFHCTILIFIDLYLLIIIIEKQN